MSQPRVTIVVPVRNSQEHIQRLLAFLLEQDYPFFEIVLVGNGNDQTWQAVPKNPKIVKVEAHLPEDWAGRDTNFKRNVGARIAIKRGADVLFYTDGKIRHQTNWISKGLEIMEAQQVQSVAGIMLGTWESAQTFLGRFTDHALVKRNPDFGKGYLLTKLNFGKKESLPITACWAMTVEAYLAMDGFPEDFRDSYEDYAASWKMVAAGVGIYVTNDWQVEHKHRSSFFKIILEYARSARGAAQMFHTYPECPFGRRRAKQVAFVMLGSIFALAYLILSFFYAPAWFSGAITLGTGLFGLAGLINVSKANHWQGLFFPPLTALFIWWFSFNFLLKMAEGGGPTKSNRWLQTMFSLILPGK